MRARSIRIATVRRHYWVEFFLIQFEGEFDRSAREYAGVLGTHEFNFTPLNGPVIAYEREVAKAAALLPNKWPMSWSEVPLELTGGPFPKSTEFASPDVWGVISRAKTTTVAETRVRLRKVLKGEPQQAVIRFQAALHALAMDFVGEHGCRWAAAALAILAGEEIYADRLAGRRPISDSYNFEYEDVVDIAEMVLGSRLMLPDGTTSRGVIRDPKPSWPDGYDFARLHAMYGVAVAEWDALPWRWEGWRAYGHRGGRLVDFILIANRPWGQSIVQMASEVVACLERAGATLSGLPQVVFPEIQRPKFSMAPFFYARHRGQLGSFGVASNSRSVD